MGMFVGCRCVCVPGHGHENWRTTSCSQSSLHCGIGGLHLTLSGLERTATVFTTEPTHGFPSTLPVHVQVDAINNKH